MHELLDKYNKDTDYESSKNSSNCLCNNNKLNHKNYYDIANKNNDVNKNNDTIKNRNEYMDRICTRSIKFCKINKDIIIGGKSFYECNEQCNCEESKCNIDENIYITSIEFTEGYKGFINYPKENQPNIGKKDFYLRIPCKVSGFIVTVNNMCNNNDDLMTSQWLIDLKLRSAIALSIVTNNSNPCIDDCFKNTSATVFACNSHILPCKLCINQSNLYNTLTDKDSYVSPYHICLFSSNVC